MSNVLMIRPRLTLVGLLFASFACASVDETLDQLHDAGKDLKTLTADVQLADEDTGGLGNDPTIRTGTLTVRRAGDDTEALVQILKKKVGKRTEDDHRDVLLKGATVVDRDYKNKKQTTRQLNGKVDLFKLGEGQFPLPIGQSKEDVKQQFDVKELKPGQLQLTPKSKTQLADRYKKITVTIDPATKFPTIIETVDPNETTITTVTLTNVKTNPELNDGAFKLPPVSQDEWKMVDAR